MRILFICDTMGSGGAERVISTLANEFVKNGHYVGVLMMSLEASESYYEIDEKIELIRLLGNQDFNFFKKSKLLRNKVIEFGPDVVVSFLSYICIYTWWALRKTKIPYIVSERSDPHQRGFIKQLLMNKSFKKAAGCVLQTNDALNYYHRVGKEKSIVIHNPVHLTSTNKNFETKNKIVAVGSLVAAKNYFLLLDAFSIFKQSHKNYSLRIYGDGPLRNELEKHIEAKKISDVELKHKSKTWHEEENDAKVFALSSFTEGMPNVLEEALCLGIPSVSTDCPIGGPKELKLLFGERLILAKNKDVNDYVDALEKSLALKHTNICVPDCLSSDYIADEWLDFIKSRILL